MKKKKLTVDQMIKEVNKILTDEYGSTMADLMLDEKEEMTRAVENGDSPREWVDWFAGKYGLTKKENFTLAMAARVMGSLGVDTKVKGNKVSLKKKK